jgi:hypothetical protein
LLAIAMVGDGLIRSNRSAMKPIGNPQFREGLGEAGD